MVIDVIVFLDGCKLYVEEQNKPASCPIILELDSTQCMSAKLTSFTESPCKKDPS